MNLTPEQANVGACLLMLTPPQPETSEPVASGQGETG